MVANINLFLQTFKIAGTLSSKWGNSQRFSWTSPARHQESVAGLHRGVCRSQDHHDARRPRQNMASSQNGHEKMNGKYANKFNTSIDWSFNQIKLNEQDTHTPWANKGVGFQMLLMRKVFSNKWLGSNNPIWVLEAESKPYLFIGLGIGPAGHAICTTPWCFHLSRLSLSLSPFPV